MNTKVLIAFVGGLVLASGITYFAMRRSDAPAGTAPTPMIAQQSPAPEADTKAAPEEPPPPPPSRGREPEEKPAPAVRQQASRPAATSKTATPPASAAAPPAVAQQTPPAPVETAHNTQPAPPPAPAANPEPPPMPRIDPPVAKANTVTIPVGTMLRVRLNETLSTERNRPGDTFTATLDQPLVIDGFVLAERGARAQGRIVEADRSGRVRGVAMMQVELTQIATSDGQKVRINTGYYEKKAESEKKKDAAKVGIGAALGAAIGAIAGGGKGAGIGAGVGGAAGAGDVLLTRGKPVEMKVETPLSFRLSEAVILTEQLR